ncbi:HER190Wp [Eremothecium sinecaudum]|uniref:Threonine synthase n=1 Tax=Eremothecium sinecaudum TaxID=45286 RepID=A0A0X8HU30_9SACH|nr:HER190Wp [Eremothecium sinecaudum]AMD21469.1 HER190Wp [Eremothecium sinecaudum]
MNLSQVYRSTRSSSEDTMSFEEAVMKGLASDGGLFIPSVIPKVPEATLYEKWSTLSFQELALEIMKLYIPETEIPTDDLKKLVDNSYSTFRNSEITPLVKNVTGSEENLHVLELFHGPTYAFKDVALQFVGNLFEYFLQRSNKGLPDDQRKKITVVGATSGDTGSAAIYGLRGKKDVSVFILYPTGRISPIQEEQMTTVQDNNVQTLSVKGTFDNCQDIVKAIFACESFNQKHNVGAVNSINWARILAQITYYFYSYFRATGGKKGAVKFVVPSGNFGDILAGYYAKKMGLDVERLVIATNENDILDRFLKSGLYERSSDAAATLSPAMDILISSNFERLLWYLAREYVAEGDSQKAGLTVNGWFQQLKTGGRFEVPAEVLEGARKDFDSERVSNAETTSTIKEIYEKSQNPKKYIIDPHTAVGIRATIRHLANSDNKEIHYISLSTAHPAKFADAVNEALSGKDGYSFQKDVLPEELRQLSSLPKRIKLVERPDVELVKDVIEESLKEMNI